MSRELDRVVRRENLERLIKDEKVREWLYHHMDMAAWMLQSAMTTIDDFKAVFDGSVEFTGIAEMIADIKVYMAEMAAARQMLLQAVDVAEDIVRELSIYLNSEIEGGGGGGTHADEGGGEEG